MKVDWFVFTGWYFIVHFSVWFVVSEIEGWKRMEDDTP